DRPPTTYAAAGRRVVRRRRLAAGTAALATAVVIGGVGWALAPGGESRGSQPPAAVDPTASAPTTTASDPEPALSKQQQRMLDTPWDDAPARALPGVGLQVREGAVVHQRRDDLYPGKDTESVALDVSFKGKR